MDVEKGINSQLKADILTNKVDGFTSVIRHGRLSFESGFDIKRVEYCDVFFDKNELLEVNRPEVGKIYIVHQYHLGEKKNIGRFIEFDNLGAAQEMYKNAFEGDRPNWRSLVEKNDKIKKYVRYMDPSVPWFYSEDRNIKRDIFVPVNFSC